MGSKFIDFVKKNKVYVILMSAFVIIFAVSAFMLISYFAAAKESSDEFEDLQNDLSSSVEDSNDSDDEEEAPPMTAQEKYGGFVEENDDFIGWISIEGTNINYPVMQSVEYPNYYLDRGFDKEYSAYGVPYVDEDATIDMSENLVIYGHHMKNKTMFSALDGYKNQDFYEEHKIINFDTLSGFGEYEVIASFKIDVVNDPFHYISYLDMDEARFNEYIANVKQRAYYDTGVSATYGDKLITLSTCEYTYDESRLVVVAKKVNTEE